MTRELTIYGSCASKGDYPACLDMIARGVIKVDPIISAVIPLSEAASYFDRLLQSGTGPDEGNRKARLGGSLESARWQLAGRNLASLRAAWTPRKAEDV